MHKFQSPKRVGTVDLEKIGHTGLTVRCVTAQESKGPVQLSPSTLRQKGSVPQGAWAKVKLPKAMTNVKYSLKLHDLTHLWNIEK